MGAIGAIEQDKRDGLRPPTPAAPDPGPCGAHRSASRRAASTTGKPSGGPHQRRGRAVPPPDPPPSTVAHLPRCAPPACTITGAGSGEGTFGADMRLRRERVVAGAADSLFLALRAAAFLIAPSRELEPGDVPRVNLPVLIGGQVPLQSPLGDCAADPREFSSRARTILEGRHRVEFVWYLIHERGDTSDPGHWPGRRAFDSRAPASIAGKPRLLPEMPGRAVLPERDHPRTRGRHRPLRPIGRASARAADASRAGPGRSPATGSAYPASRSLVSACQSIHSGCSGSRRASTACRKGSRG